MYNKVVFSLTRLGKENKKETGKGYIANDVLVLFVKGNDGELHRKFIDSYTKYLFPSIGKQGEYKGYYTEYNEDVEILRKDGSYDILDTTETNYYIWIKKFA